jgi:sulfate transport system ATP-binding protein
MGTSLRVVPSTDAAARGSTRIDIELVSKTFGATPVLDGITLTVEPGELLALLGPSGSGKTTLLRCLAGLEHVSSGAIRFDGRDATRMSLKERRVGFVFQHYALFRHMSVFENVAFGLRVRDRRERPGEGEIRRKVLELLDLLQLPGLEKRFPSQLSGGQRQRVAIARALAIEPSVLLLDEPFGALDALVRKDLRKWLRQVCDITKVTTVFVTHDQEEALELADRVAVMNRGRIEQLGSPVDLFEEPGTSFICEFLGSVNRFETTFADGYADVLGSPFPLDETRASGSGRAVAYVRAHEIEVVNREHADGQPAVIRAIHPFGGAIRVELAVQDVPGTVEMSVPRELWELGEIRAGHGIFVRPVNARVFPLEG